MKNYWPMSNLNDVIGGANLYGGFNFFFTYDRFCTSDSAIYLSSGFLQIPPNTYFSRDFTVTAWFYLKSFIIGSEIIFSSNGNNSDSVSFFFNSENRLCGNSNLNITVSAKVCSSASSLQLNQWYHGAWVLNGTTSYIYLNGNRIATKTSFPSPRNVTRNINLIGNNNTYKPNAIYDELKIYEGALTPDQILNDYINSSNNSKILRFKC